MNYTLQNNLRLLARNEGKIKTYESCSDVRAWSHDVNAKVRHLREWMKCDMPICVIPISTLTDFLRIMTCKSRRRVAPRCHPDCKSKALLESICKSCEAMRECMKQDANFEKYFVEEDLTTSQWPCERCLEALKSITMFWKIIIEKIFCINIKKKYDLETNCNSGDSVRSIAKTWQNEMVQQAQYVKSITHLLRNSSSKIDTKEEATHGTIKSSTPIRENKYLKQIGKMRNTSNTTWPHETRNPRVGISKKITQSTYVKVKVNNTGCDPCFLEKENDEIQAHLKNLKALQDKCNRHIEEVETLKKENNSLRIELQNVSKSSSWRASFYSLDKHGSHVVQKPFEVAMEKTSPALAKSTDSEMTITMKKYKHEKFRYVSLLQVLHKSNEPRIEYMNNGLFYKKDDPIEILTKVQNTFGAIVKRELGIANGRRQRAKKQAPDKEATFHKINASISAPYWSTSSSRLSSDLNFMSAKETSERQEIS